MNDVDPLRVPLPNGTQVSTRIDRVVEGRVVLSGAVGRVVAQAGDALDVQVVGVGIVRYARDQLRPRNVVQARYAARRAHAWEDLHSCRIVETVVGSRAWGLADEHSDTDLRGVFALPSTFTSGLAEPPRDLTSAGGSETYWEVSKAMRQALRADPNTLEALFLPEARALDEIGEWLLAGRVCFVSREIYGAFGRYALSQISRLEKLQRLTEGAVELLPWMRTQAAPTLELTAARLRAVGGLADDTDGLHQARETLKTFYRMLHERGRLTEPSFDALLAFARAETGEALVLELSRALRPKNAYNLVRLLHTAIIWLRTGEPVFRLEGDVRARLLGIKAGQVSLDAVVAEVQALTPELEAARRETRLPRQPDFRAADALLRRVNLELARRFVAQVPGPFGRDAPTPPEPETEST
jgi:hypothetical protein